MVGAGESQSRAESKESTRKRFNETNGESLKLMLCDMLERPNPQQAEINESVEKLCKTFERDSKLREAKAESEELKDEMQLQKEEGNEEQVNEIKAQLMTLYKRRREEKARSRVSAAGPVHQDKSAEGLPLVGAGGVYEGLSDGEGGAAAGFGGAPLPGCIDVGL